MKTAIVTPYYKEDLLVIKRCHDSISNQTHAVTHIMVSDGFPKSEIDSWDCVHVKIPNCGDFGDTPRGIGAQIAASLGFDAVAFVDADCWIEPDHIQLMVEKHENTLTPIVTCPRNLYRSDASFMKVDNESDGITFNDTNCYLFTKSVFKYLATWMFKSKEMSMVGDRILWNTLVRDKIPCSRIDKPTLNYTTTFAVHYLSNNETPPDDSKVIAAENGKYAFMTWSDAQNRLNK